ncbi:MAG TPA: CRISPR-associated endonuclease Cas1 [Pyrinomonadaceae bacterium]|jgi:CRISPR-associated protein Cas1
MNENPLQAASETLEGNHPIVSNNEPIPARMINEFAYCPRLFYLEYVQREWSESADTLDGSFVHRRVDKESGKLPEKTEEKAEIHARSVWLGSENLNVSAKIDVLEADGKIATPIDYKRGKPKDVDEGVYEPERVQLCLQGLILRENGFECDKGFIYFAESQQKVKVEFTPELILRTVELLMKARRIAESGEIPPPLIDSPKCVGCSLAGICLPDEINLLRHTDEDADSPRRLMPLRDDALPVYVQGAYGLSVGLKGDCLEIREKGKTVSEAKIFETSQMSLFGNVQISAQAIRELASREVPVVHLSYGGWLSAVTAPPPHKNIELRRAQFASANDSEKCLKLARSFVSGKIYNQRTLLRRNAKELPNDSLVFLREMRRKSASAKNLQELLGMEGAAAREYFSKFALMFKQNGEQPAFDFTTRNRRPPKDPINALLSFLYSMLMKEMLVTLIGIGFDPYLGFYHQPRYGRPALALDLMEEFRPIVADSVVIGLINTGEIRKQDFITRLTGCALTDSGRKRVIEAFERRLNTTITHPVFGYTVSYRRIFEIQARLLARFLTGEISEYPSFITR